MTGQSSAVDHIGIVVRDLDAVLAFIGRAWGFVDVSRSDRPDTGVTIAMVACGGGVLEFIEPWHKDQRLARLGSDVARIEHVAIAVPSLNKSLDGLARQGVTWQPSQPPYQISRGRPCVITDPRSSGGIQWQVIERGVIRD